MSRYTASTDRPLSGAPDRIDVTGSNESCVRVDGGAAGSAVTNLGPCVVQYADAVAPDDAYADLKILEVGDTADVAINGVCDFWATGAGRSSLVISHPDPAPIAQTTPEPTQAADVPADAPVDADVSDGDPTGPGAADDVLPLPTEPDAPASAPETEGAPTSHDPGAEQPGTASADPAEGGEVPPA